MEHVHAGALHVRIPEIIMGTHTADFNFILSIHRLPGDISNVPLTRNFHSNRDQLQIPVDGNGMALLPAITFTSIAIALLGTLVIHFHRQADDSATKFASQHTKKYDEDLIQLAKIASISSLPEHSTDIEKAAEWLVTRLKAAEIEVIPDFQVYQL